MIYSAIETRREGLAASCQERLKLGESLQELVPFLHDHGLSICESIWVLNRATQQSLRPLKDVITAHPVWRSVVEATEPLHDELETYVREHEMKTP